jgi:hypothetical protein
LRAEILCTNGTTDTGSRSNTLGLLVLD